MLYAMFAGIVGYIMIAIGKQSENGAIFTIFGSIMCLISAILFFMRAF